MGVFIILGNYYYVKIVSLYCVFVIEGDFEVDEEDDDYMVVWCDIDFSFEFGYVDFKCDLGSMEICVFDDFFFNQGFNSFVYWVFNQFLIEGVFINFWVLFGWQDQIGGNGVGVNLVGLIGLMQGCLIIKRVVLIGIVIDCGYIFKFRNKEEV